LQGAPSVNQRQTLVLHRDNFVTSDAANTWRFMVDEALSARD
jgi:hypothetical protein